MARWRGHCTNTGGGIRETWRRTKMTKKRKPGAYYHGSCLPPIQSTRAVGIFWQA